MAFLVLIFIFAVEGWWHFRTLPTFKKIVIAHIRLPQSNVTLRDIILLACCANRGDRGGAVGMSDHNTGSHNMSRDLWLFMNANSPKLGHPEKAKEKQNSGEERA